ncbi:MAG: ATP-binding cassette domain-containing protein [Bacteroidales bacterium]|jgi:ABC-2 type transport system ATP-binding protein|nr:ATP-binding cassette domain-containing protein [Bacteroidales bacterium]MCI2121375.1 ATP-binding cassette domain-containing protein [Bacteroidales bacterium]MCI2145506.1 ATP-binding cassette domain-containing protein [Bacteroidales bacterium]
MISIENLQFGYGKQTVFSDISLTFLEGQTYGLLGRNGVGKTTLLKLLSGLQEPKEGKIEIDGMNPWKRNPNMYAEMYFLEENAIIPNVRINDYAKSIGDFYPHFDYAEFLEIANNFETSVDVKYSALSSGQRKKALISLALALNTKYLFLDEPSNSLDIPSKLQLRKSIAAHSSEGHTVIISTHQVRDLEDVIDPIVILDKDSVLLDASLAEISKKITFNYDPTENKDALYSEPVLGGYVNLLSNAGNYESNVNIEALFDAFHTKKELFRAIFRDDYDASCGKSREQYAAGRTEPGEEPDADPQF